MDLLECFIKIFCSDHFDRRRAPSSVSSFVCLSLRAPGQGGFPQQQHRFLVLVPPRPAIYRRSGRGEERTKWFTWYVYVLSLETGGEQRQCGVGGAEKVNERVDNEMR